VRVPDVPERRVPRGRWGATWLVAVAFAAGSVIGLELFVRGRGYQPSLKDDEYAWAWQRGRVSDGSHRTIAVLGASRIQLAFSAAALREALPGWRAVQLAVNGTYPMGALRDLAADPAFRGVALVDTTVGGFYRETWASQDAQVTAYRRRWRAPGAMIERRLATFVQMRLAILAIGGTRLLAALAETGEFPRPPYVVTAADRTRFADYALADVAALRARRGGRVEAGEDSDEEAAQWLAEALELEASVAAIQARGGHVVYLRMPTCDERWETDERTRPKARFWDRLAAKTGAVAIHFRDEPTLASFACPDGSHIASKDGPRFTRALIEILVARGVIAVAR